MGKLWEPNERYYQSRFNKNKRNTFFAKDTFLFRYMKKFFFQAVASFILFLMMLFIFQLNTPSAVATQQRIRIWFTQDYDVQPVLQFFSKVGLWGDTFDRAAFEAIKRTEPSLSLAIPVSGQVMKPFGWIKDGNQQYFHEGIVIAAAENLPIKAALAGAVTKIAQDETMGRIVEITGKEGIVTVYGHCKEILVDLNDDIVAGQVIAKVGKTGQVSYPQLFFGISNKGEYLDPAQYFSSDEKV